MKEVSTGKILMNENIQLFITSIVFTFIFSKLLFILIYVFFTIYIFFNITPIYFSDDD